jgi:predicted GTPase
MCPKQEAIVSALENTGYIKKVSDDLFEIRGNERQIAGIISRQRKGKAASQKRWDLHKKYAKETQKSTSRKKCSEVAPSIEIAGFSCSEQKNDAPGFSSVSSSFLCVNTHSHKRSANGKKILNSECEIPESEPLKSESISEQENTGKEYPIKSPNLDFDQPSDAIGCHDANGSEK